MPQIRIVPDLPRFPTGDGFFLRSRRIRSERIASRRDVAVAGNNQDDYETFWCREKKHISNMKFPENTENSGSGICGGCVCMCVCVGGGGDFLCIL